MIKKTKMKIFSGILSLLIMLASVSAQNIKLAKVQPTPCLKKDKDRLIQLYHISIANKGRSSVKAQLQVQTQTAKYDFVFPSVDTGTRRYDIFLPEVKSADSTLFILTSGKDRQTLAQTLVPQRHWTIYLIHHSHSDIGYTNLQSQIARSHAEYIDSAMAYCRRTENYPEGCKFKWNEEITWSTEQFLNSRTPEQISQLAEWIKKGRIEIAGWYIQMSDLCSHEGIIRNVYYGNVVKKALSCNIQSSMCDDINGLPWSSPQILSKAGIRYFSMNLNEDRARTIFTRSYPFYWQSPGGSKVLVWNGEHYMFGNFGLHIHEGYKASFTKVVDELVKNQSRENYPYDIVAYNISGYMTDNSKPNMILSDVAKEWYDKWEYPKVKLALLNEFFSELESRYSSVIPTHSAAWPDYWTDGTASTAYETGLHRVSQPTLYSAEKFASFLSILKPQIRYPYTLLNDANRLSLLYAEHTWGSWNSIWEPFAELTKGQWAVKSTYAYISKENADVSLERSLSDLSTLVASENPEHLIVFNSLGWTVTNVVKADVPQKFKDMKTGFEVTDARTKKSVAVQFTGTDKFMFVATDVPSHGYCVYHLKPAARITKAETAANKTITGYENNFYAIKFDNMSGGLMRIYDKELKVQLVDTTSPYHVNQYIYENPKPAGCRIHNINKCDTGFSRYSPENTEITMNWSGELATKFTITSTPRMAKSLRQEIVIYNTIKRIEITNLYDKTETFDPEAVYFAFPFNVPKGTFTEEIANGTMVPEKEQLPGSSRDWMAAQQWVDVSNKNYGILFSAIEAPMIQYGAINTGTWLDTLTITNQTLFSYAMNNYWFTNFKASQEGPHTFRYVITSHRGDLNKVTATRFGSEQFNPLYAVYSDHAEKGMLPETGYSFLNIDQQNVIIQAVKQAEDGDGYIVRLRELTGKETKVTLTSPLFAESRLAYLTTITENNLNAIAVAGGKIAVTVKPYEIVTIRMKP